MINIKKINDRMNELNITKAQLIRDSGLTRVTVDKVFKGGNINVDTLEALAKGLGVSVGFFFDDDKVEDVANTQTVSGIQQNAGRDASFGFDLKEHDELVRLREEVKFLREMIKDRDERIADLKERVEELKGDK